MSLFSRLKGPGRAEPRGRTRSLFSLVRFPGGCERFKVMSLFSRLNDAGDAEPRGLATPEGDWERFKVMSLFSLLKAVFGLPVSLGDFLGLMIKSVFSRLRESKGEPEFFALADF